MAETLSKGPTPGVKLAAERIKAIAAEGLEDRYPPGTAFVALDMPGASEAIGRYVRMGRPVVLIYDDGFERMIQTPRKIKPGGLLGFLSRRRRFRARRARIPA
jgi:hypothetical protein